ncbi:MAG: hypothetical protein M9921_00645 [Fimbriimonadaceae bacterium]|nr:M61 family metallopeptidase [Chthonomonadaceae bacterium]MCO5295342.1 hypothetical protein [Fimbriimonadaceae bacterium]
MRGTKNTTRGMLLALAFAVCSLAGADLQYRVEPDPANESLKLSITIPSPSEGVRLQMPRWAPGSYRLTTNFRNVRDLTAVDESGKAVEVQHPDDWTWSLAPSGAKSVTVRYTCPSPMVGGAMHFSGPSTYLYVVDRLREPCTVAFSMPDKWIVAIGLDESKGAKNTFYAPNYDVLADNPATLGEFALLGYVVQGKPHFIALRGGAADDVDREGLVKACRFVTESEGDFFGGLPYSKYVWHFNVNDSPDGAGGLEHLSSTQISLASGVGPRAVSVLAHEFFHLWNVKRIRSAPLGPFDYTQLPKTGALWWLEGVTDYYAHHLLHRYGWWDTDRFHQDILDNVRTVRARPQRLEVSPYDASFRVGEAAGGRGNSQGFGVSYYDTGWLLGLCLDIEIRSQTGGKRSLDDVMRALWDLCRNGKPGFAEDEIRKQCVRFGGPALGPFYDKIVMQPGELPVEEQLAKIGLRMSERLDRFVDVGFDWAAVRAEQAVRVRNVHGPAKDRLRDGDRIIEANGKSLKLPTTRAIYATLQPILEKATTDEVLLLRVLRDGEEIEVRILPELSTRTGTKIDDAAPGDLQKRALREGLYYDGVPHKG